MMRIGAVLLLLALLCSAAHAERRVALVIGNSAYKVGPLTNPINDAQAVAAAFNALGFTTTFKQDLTIDGMRSELRDFGRTAAAAEIAAVYFAGHGTEVAGRNYLIPIDAQLARAADIDLEAIGLDAVLSQIDGVQKLRLVILDACRNNVFPLHGRKRAVSRGLARVEPEGNTLVAYAARDGTTADDGAGRHSPFAEAFLKHVATPGLDVSFVFRRVRDDVMKATNGSQQPYVYGTLGGEAIYLHNGSAEQRPPMLMAGVPPLQAVGARCRQEHSVRSLEGTISTAITFVNNYGSTIRTYWIDYQGARKFYAEVLPGSSYVQQTYVTHPWVVTSSQEDCLGVYLPSSSPRRIVIGR